MNRVIYQTSLRLEASSKGGIGLIPPPWERDYYSAFAIHSNVADY